MPDGTGAALDASGAAGAAQTTPGAAGAAQTTPGAAGAAPWTDSEVGRLRTVLLHRPGQELARLTPRNNDSLLFDGIPWLERAQEEHDAFAATLRDHDVEVLYLTGLLTEVLADAGAREQAVADAVAASRAGIALGARLADVLAELDPVELAGVLTAGLRNDELAVDRRGRPVGATVVGSLLAPEDFVLDPLPNLLFTRDSSAWVGSRVAVTSLAMPARRRETALTGLVYRHHPRFAAAGEPLYGPDREPLEGGDVLLLGAGVVAVGTGERTTPAGVERLAAALMETGAAHTVLAVPVAQQRATMHLDTVATMVDVDTVLMYPAAADTLQAWTVTAAGVTGPRPFLRAAADALGLPEFRHLDTGLDPVTAEREQWDDGNNTLCVDRRLAVAYERNVETNDRLEAQGIEVLRIAGSELGSGRGGPRCMSCPVRRDPAGGSGAGVAPGTATGGAA